LNAGIRCSAFHEGLTILERDRAAAWFSDEDDGAQALVCSEIGSEGRNFQFAHHLVLFDLPLNPDLLEQRIGRLDRIGQRHTIEIHVPYLRDTAQEIMFRWYHEGLNLFERSSAIGYSVYEKFENRLREQLRSPAIDGKLAQLIKDTAQFTESSLEKLRAGRDRLLELHSCDANRANELIAVIRREEQSERLEKYMEQVFDYFGVHHEHHSNRSLVLTPGDHMQSEDFPWLGEEGMTVTFDRNKALAREDMHFLTWEHPMVTESMEMICNTETGNASISTISIKSLPAASLLLEAYFTIDAVAPKVLQLQQYLPITPIRTLLSSNGKELGGLIPQNKLNLLCRPVNKDAAHAIASQVRPRIENMLAKARSQVEPRFAQIKNTAKEKASRQLTVEKQRLSALQKVNTTIRDDEIEFIDRRLNDCLHYLDRADIQLQALRLIINQQ
jgi:ATP-dependent helicase HepA